jgi:HlyD family secretion protein
MTRRTVRSNGKGGSEAASRALALIIILLSLAGQARPIEEKTKEVPRIARGDFQPVLVLTGSLTALRSEEFKVPITESWRIQIKWMAKEGDSVKPGDSVVRFDTANLAAELETAQEALRTKREEKAQKEADYRHQKFELEVAVRKAENEMRQKEIDASIPPGIEAKSEYDRKQLEKTRSDYSFESAETNKVVKLAETESQIKALGIELGELEARLAKIRISLDELTLVAHSPGAVIYAVDDWSGRKVQVGDTVFATRVIAQIPDLASLQVQAWISETHVQQIKVGQEVGLFLDAYPGRRFRGVLRDISESAESVRRWGKSNYFRADIEIGELDLDIMKPGMSAKCDVLGTPHKNVLLVPLEMAVFDGSSFWIKLEKAEPIRVTPLGFNEFVLAVSPEKNPDLKAGMVLQAIEGLKAGGEAKAGEKKTGD